MDKSHSSRRPRGLIRTETLRSLGLSRQAIAARCHAHSLIRVHHGVYFVGHSDTSPLATAEAAVLACGDRTTLSHDSAAALWNLRKWPRIPEVSSPLHRRRPGIRAHRTLTLTRRDVTVHHGIRVTTVARTTADIAARLTDIQLDQPDPRGPSQPRPPEPRTRPPATRSVPAPPTSLTPRKRRAAASSSTSSKRSWSRLDLPIPEFEARWHGYEVDAFYEDHRLIIELDGYHDHSQPDRFEADRERDAKAIELNFDTLRITWKRLKRRPAPLARQFRAILAGRDPHARR